MFRKYSISEDIDIFESPEHNWFNADQSPIQYFEDS